MYVGGSSQGLSVRAGRGQAEGSRFYFYSITDCNQPVLSTKATRTAAFDLKNLKASIESSLRTRVVVVG
jgi:hypothetical protein